MTTDIRHPIFARFFDRLSRKVAVDPEMLKHRRELVAGLSGRVVEVGAGNGLNFAHYPAAVTEVVAVEPEPYLRGKAEASAQAAAAPITVVAGQADQLPLEDNSCDAAVASLVLCTVPEPAIALAEIQRVLKPGGELRFFEHVAARPGSRLARIQKRLDRTIWPTIGGGCHASRDTAQAIEQAGFTVEQLQRLTLRPSILLTVTSPHILGSARKECVP